MKDLFEMYITQFPFNGKDFYFDWFLKLNDKHNFITFERMINWYFDNNDEAKELLFIYKKLIDKNNISYQKEYEDAIRHRVFALPTLENVTTYISMFDES